MDQGFSHLVARQHPANPADCTRSTCPVAKCTLTTCPLSYTSMGYLPSVGGNAFYAVVFALLVPVQLYFGLRYRTWGFTVGLLGGLALEIVGYIGRILVHSKPFEQGPFLMQIVTLTIGPAFLSAAIYLCLARIVVVYGESFSRVRPRTYSILFVTSDFFALLLQAAGGAMASSATSGSSSQKTGINVMLAGLSVQVASLVFFMTLCADFAFQAYRNKAAWVPAHASLRSTRLWKLFLIALTVATFTIFVRSVFRVAELSAGFDSKLAQNQATFMILEGAMIVIATVSMTVFHPGFSFQGAYSNANFRFRSKSSAKALEAGSVTPDEPLSTRSGILS